MPHLIASQYVLSGHTVDTFQARDARTSMPKRSHDTPRPVISVVIPVFDRAATIEYCLRSVLDQTLPPAEVIAVDDCSRDRTSEIVRGYSDPRVRLISLAKNSGAQAARNAGIGAATGNWIAFQDSDDEWLPGKLAAQVKALAGVGFDPFTVVHGNCLRREGARGDDAAWSLPCVEGGEAYPQLLRNPGPLFPAMLVSRRALETIGFLDEQVPSYQEWDTAIRLAKVCRFIHLDEPLFIYHLHSGETISKNPLRDVRGYQYIVEKFAEEIISKCGIEAYEQHLRLNATRALDFGLFQEAGLILSRRRRVRAALTVLSLAASLHIRPTAFGKVRNFTQTIRNIIGPKSI